MATDITKTLGKALKQLQGERKRIDRQIAAIEGALAGVAGRGGRVGRPSGRRKRGRKPMSAAARKAVGRRMKAYWKRRRAGAAKGKTEPAK
jgi:hypothetical protein